MKKIILLFSVVLNVLGAQAQTILDPGMETWRTGSSGTFSPVTIYAPVDWNGMDSIIIADGQEYGILYGIPATAWQRQVFEEDTIVHSGAHSAKLITLKQDTLGMFPGLLTNTNININVRALMGGGGTASAISYSGGMPDTLKVVTVSAWTVYIPGKDSLGAPSLDSGSLMVQAVSNFHGYDSIIGTGFVLIPPSDTFIQVTANMVYVDSTLEVDTVRIFFASSGGANVTDSSILYVDDVSATGVIQPVLGIKKLLASQAVKVYPNPANGVLDIDGIAGTTLQFTLCNINGAVVTTAIVNGKTKVDINAVTDGLYFYTLTDDHNMVVQHGKVSVIK
jgi:hypothetical protein